MRNLVALKKFRFGRLVLEVGDHFEARDGQAKVLRALGRAADTSEKDFAPIDEPRTNERAELREEYMRVYGKRPFMGWDEGELRNRIARYDRRDMRPAP